MLGSCSDPIEVSEPTAVPYSPGTVTISFKNSNMTRSDDSDNSETKIENLIVGLYVDSPDETVPPVAFQTFESLTNVYKNHQVVMQLTDDMIDALFTKPAKIQCRLFAVANVPEGTTVPDNATINQLKQLPVTADFRNTSLQSSFVMTGAGDVTYTPPEAGEKVGSASGAATLYRAAAKIRLNLQIPDTIHVGNATDFEIWAPIKENARALLNNGVQMAVAAPKGTADIPWKPENQNAYYNSTLKTGSERAFKNEGTGTYSYIMDVPFYTYPNAWEESTLEDNKTTLTLILPWGKQGEQSWNTYYYQIPITPVNLPHLDRNYSYTVNLKVGMLGSLTPEVPVTPEEDLSYQIVNWGNKEVDVDIKDFRYLVVNPNVVTVNNESEILIPFYSSHPVSPDNISMTYERFAFVTATGNADIGKVVHFTIDETQITKSNKASSSGNLLTYEITTDPSNSNQKVIKITHPLILWTPVRENGTQVDLTGYNSASDSQVQTVASQIDHYIPTTEPAYSSYRITIHIAHTDVPQYEETVTIIQYPGMYIEADRNPATSTTGNVFVNGYSNSNGGLGNVNGISNQSSNRNPNMYVISISQLSTSDYIIGDPRSTRINNDLSGNGTLNTTTNSTDVATWDNTATALYKPLPNGTSPNQRHLAYYYPTIESTADQYSKMVAPRIRVASSWGVVGTIERQTARRRAATYQEQNKPAGRWRMPTRGELEFIVNLSRTGKIPTLFNPGGDYWTAQGVFTVSSTSSGTTILSPSNSRTAFIRAVYDEWYWEQYPDYTITSGSNGRFTYTLGDMPRQLPN